MAVRSGMTTLISRWRRMVDDDGTAIWTDAQAQQILDQHRRDFYQEALTVTPVEIATGTVAYHVYMSAYSNLEEAASGTTAWRVYTSNGTEQGTALYTPDYINGIVRFSADQGGTAYYLDGRSYDLHGAAADAWRERAADTAAYYSFGADGASYSRSHWFEHCMKMADHYDRQAWATQVTFTRGDVTP